jgi:glycosyltransferase involved in cell wall biosynthesis
MIKTVSCIIPAYNEEARLGIVLSIVSGCEFIDEIIVIDDCSTDTTSYVASQYKNITLIKHEKNMGKSKSVYDGVKVSKGEILLFLDADLQGLTQSSVKSLLAPIMDGSADISISLRNNAPGLWKIIELDYLSGERCFSRIILQKYLQEIPSLKGFELEVFINRIIINNKLKTAIIPWKTVESPFKRKKFGLYLDFFIMGYTVLTYISPLEIISQIYHLKKLTV